MLLLPNTEVQRDPETGELVLDEEGRVCVQLLTDKDNNGPSGTGTVGGGSGNNEHVAKTLELSEAAPESMNFSLMPSWRSRNSFSNHGDHQRETGAAERVPLLSKEGEPDGKERIHTKTGVGGGRICTQDESLTERRCCQHRLFFIFSREARSKSDSLC